MKTSMERVYPIAKDMQEQLEDRPYNDFVFFYDDGVFRAFGANGVHIDEHKVTAWTKFDGKTTDLITLPADTPWRLIHKSLLEFVNGATMEQLELIGTRQKQELRDKMFKKLGWDEEGKKTKKSKTDLKVEGIPLTTGQYA